MVEDWGIERFEKVLLDLIGEMPKSGEDKLIDHDLSILSGIHLQKQEGLFYLGLDIPNGRMTAQDLEKLASLADKYGNGMLRLGISKNVLITHIEKVMMDDLLTEEILTKFLPGESFNTYAISCTGKEFCTKAVVRTKPWMQAIIKYLDSQFSMKLPIKFHMSGCPSACGQTQIADIGFQGTVIKGDNGPKEAFEIFIGDKLGQEAGFAQKLAGKIPGKVTPLLAAEFLKLYLSLRNNTESFHQFVKRVGVTPFQNKLNEILTLANSMNHGENKMRNVV